PIPTTGMDASRPRPADATRAARHTVGTESRALRGRRAIFVAGFRPRPIRFIWSTPVVAYHWELSCRTAIGREHSGAYVKLRTGVHVRTNPHFAHAPPAATRARMGDAGDEHVRWFA